MSEQNPSPLALLYQALSLAQSKAKPVAHDAKNTHNRYEYTSSEAVIVAALAQLSGCGLSVAPVSSKVNGKWLHREYSLAHDAGATIMLQQDWPIVENNRKLDKAFASACTTSFAYFLRDLLLIPRCDSADDEAHHSEQVNRRDQQKSRRDKRDAGTFNRPKRPKPPEQTNSNDYGERRRNQDKPSGRLRVFFDVEKFFPGLDENYVLKADDYCVSMLEESDTPVQGRTIADCKDWREAAIHFSRENNWAEWKDLNDHDRALVLIAAELEKPADKKAA